MRYSNALEITAMTLLWAAVLIWYDIASKPTAAQMQTVSNPQVDLWIPNVRCSGKVTEALQALHDVPWLDKPDLKHVRTFGTEAEAHAQHPEAASCDIGVLANVRDVDRADFLEIYNVLRRLDVVPTTVEFGGLPHFALQAKVANLRCEGCDQDTMEALKRSAAAALVPRKDPKFGETFKWRDSEQVDLKNQTITAFVRFNNAVHVHEMVWALTQAGFPPLSIRVVSEEKGPTAHR